MERHGRRPTGKAQLPARTSLAAPDISTLQNVPLTKAEKDLFQKCEVTLRKGLKSFIEVGTALLTIRANKLYRIEFETFEDYCRQKWDISRSYAYRVIGASERLQLLPANTNLPMPTNEFQIRPLLKLDPTEFPKL